VCFALAVNSTRVKYLRSKTSDKYTQDDYTTITVVKNVIVQDLKPGSVLAVTANIGLGCKSLPGQTYVYYVNITQKYI
jgi:hypothetical protein